jgi:hypothetical protein
MTHVGNSPQWNAFVESLKEMYPEEFSKKPQTLAAFLRDADQNVVIEEQYLDNPLPVERIQSIGEEEESPENDS